MKRELKFRLYFHDEELEALTYSTHSFRITDKELQIMQARFEENTIVGFVQYTGLKDKNGKEIYEGDIFRIEEDGAKADEPDRIFYVVITWVQEWCMFCSLLADSEYFDYKNDGIKALDEPMFWTYTLEDTNSRKHFLCGNIFEHPHLLTEESRKKKEI